jgi:NADPH2:quinone reductase
MVGMEAIRLHEFGPADHLRLETLPDLAPGPGQVRIAVAAAGVHLVDTRLRRGEPGPVPPPELPTIPGREVGGVVDLVGAGVDKGWLGRRVVAHLGPVPGGYAEQAVTAVGNLFDLPEGVGYADAVAMTGTGRTAVGILELEPIRADDVVFVPSAAGGLGWLLVQAARSAGATVVAAVGSPEKAQLVKDLGADLVLDYNEGDWMNGLDRPLSLVYDGVGGAVGRTALERLAPGGRFVMFGMSSGKPTAFDQNDVIRLGISVSWSLGPRMAALPGGMPGLASRALQRLATGAWRPLVSTYPLAHAARAHADLERRRAVGKVVLTVGQQSIGY